MQDQDIRLISEDEIEAATLIFTDAFMNDPLWTSIPWSEKRRKENLVSFFRIYSALACAGKKLYVTGTPPQGGAIWSMPGQHKLCIFKKLSILIRYGAIRMLFNPSLLAFRNIQPVFRDTVRMHKQYAPHEHYYLDMLAVDPESWGRGTASRVVKPMLEKAKQEHMGVYLETTTERNVQMYEHFGFKLMEKAEFKKLGLNVWALYKEP
jgi:GNAT superfamily N-acetyltransferase